MGICKIIEKGGIKYIKLKYLQSHGDEYIDLKKSFSNYGGLTFKVKYALTSLTPKSPHGTFPALCIIWQENHISSGWVASGLRVYNMSDLLQSTYATSNLQLSGKAVVDKDYEVEVINKAGHQMIKVGELKNEAFASPRYDYLTSSITIFAGRYQEESNKIMNKSSIKLYYLKIYDNDDNLIFDFIQVKRVSDGAMGLLNLVDNVFFGNDGSGAFSGEPVYVSKIKRLKDGKEVTKITNLRNGKIIEI